MVGVLQIHRTNLIRLEKPVSRSGVSKSLDLLNLTLEIAIEQSAVPVKSLSIPETLHRASQEFTSNIMSQKRGMVELLRIIKFIWIA